MYEDERRSVRQQNGDIGRRKGASNYGSNYGYTYDLENLRIPHISNGTPNGIANGDIGRRKGVSNYGYSHDSENTRVAHIPNGAANGAVNKKTVVIIGTGDLGMALTMCFVRSGYRVVVASRNPEKNRKRISEIGGEIDFIERAVQQSSIIVIAIPFEAFDTLSAKELKSKIVVDVSNRPFDYNPKKKTLADRLQRQLPESSVVKAFNTLSAYALLKGLNQGSKEVPICSNDEEARTEIIHLTRTLGFTPVDYGSLSNAKAIEDIPLEFFSEWRVAMITGICVFLFAFIYLLFKRQLCPNFENLSNDKPWNWSLFESLPLTTFHHAYGITSITLLAACYFPGVIAAYLQLKRGTKYSKFPNWLDKWLKARKTMGVLALLLSLVHLLLATLTEVAYGGFDIEWRHCLYLFCGVMGFMTMLILGITSFPSVASSMTWREFSFVHRYLGWFCLFFATLHYIFLKWKHIISNEFSCIFLPDSSQIFLWFPLITIVLKLPLLLPCVDNKLQKIRRGFEKKKEPMSV